MNKTFITQIAGALLALTLAVPAAASDGLPERAVSAVGAAIAAQGNAALVQIREDLKRTLLERIAPYLPEPAATSADAKPAKADAGN